MIFSDTEGLLGIVQVGDSIRDPDTEERYDLTVGYVPAIDEYPKKYAYILNMSYCFPEYYDEVDHSFIRVLLTRPHSQFPKAPYDLNTAKEQRSEELGYVFWLLFEDMSQVILFNPCYVIGDSDGDLHLSNLSAEERLAEGSIDRLDCALRA